MIDGLLVMRGQPFHFGHIRPLDAALDICDRVFVILGSTQEHGTEKNPFTFSERKMMIRRYYEDLGLWEKIRILGLPDIFSLRWPAYVLESIDKVYPDAEIAHIFGGSEYDVSWFSEYAFMTPHVIDRTKANYPFISATMIREMLIFRDPRWMEYVPKCNWDIVARKYLVVDMLNENV